MTASNSQPEDLERIEEKMIRAGAFNPDDLVFNLAGELSPRQQRWLKFELAAWVLQIIFYAIGLVCAWLVYYAQYQYTDKFFIGGLFWSAILGVCLVSCFNQAKPVWIDLKNNKVQSVSGMLSKSAPSYRNNRSRPRGFIWVLTIQKDIFTTGVLIYDAIAEGHRYRIFFTPNLKERPINIEPLSLVHQQKQSTLTALQAHVKEKQESNP